MNYAAHYERLIERARGRLLVGYRERHHVVPKCMGGGNESANIVKLTGEEHYVAHQLLTKMFPSVQWLALAAIRMAKHCTGNKVYGWLRRRLSASMTGKPLSDAAYEKLVKNKRTPEARANSAQKQRGKKHSEATKLKIRTSKIGKKRSAESIAKSSAGLMGHVTSEETKRKIGLANKGNTYNRGRKHSAESRAAMAVAAKKRTDGWKGARGRIPGLKQRAALALGRGKEAYSRLSEEAKANFLAGLERGRKKIQEARRCKNT